MNETCEQTRAASPHFSLPTPREKGETTLRTIRTERQRDKKQRKGRELESFANSRDMVGERKKKKGGKKERKKDRSSG